MAYAAFADAPVDVAIVEVGMGGVWDATNVADGAVAVVTPIGVDHAAYLGTSVEEIALEKAGIIKPGATAVLAEQLPGPAEVLLRRCAEVEATPVREGLEFDVLSRVPAVGGQLLTLKGLHGQYDDVFLPLYGAHQAQNAVTALAAVEAFAGDQPLDADLVREAFSRTTSPGRLEIIRRSPMILLDAAHNPHGAAADRAGARGLLRLLASDRGHRRDVGQGVRGRARGLRAASRRTWSSPRTRRHVPFRQQSWPPPRARCSAPDRVTVAPKLADAIDEATALAEAGGPAARPSGRARCWSPGRW